MSRPWTVTTSPWARALASALVPGAGQALARRWRSAALHLSITVAALAALAVVVGRTPGGALRIVSTREGLAVFLAANAVLLAARVVAAVDAHRGGTERPHGTRRPTRTLARLATVTLALVLVAVPHAALGYYAARTHQVLSGVFAPAPPTTPAPVAASDPEADDGDPGPAAPVVPDAPATTDDGTDPGDHTTGDTDEDGAATDDPGPRFRPGTLAPDGRLTVALLGSDAGPGRGGARLDAMLVATLDTTTGQATIVSVDRYFADFPLPGELADIHATSCPQDDGWRYLNALHRCLAERAEGMEALYPGERDPAAAAMREVLGQIVGLRVDHHVLVDMEGFVRLVDAFGGVEVDLARPLKVTVSPAIAGEDWIEVDLPAGRQELDGRSALAFVRDRKDSGDRARTQRQRCLLVAVADRADRSTVVRRYGALLRVIEDHVGTSIPLNELPALVGLLSDIDTDRLVTVGLGGSRHRRPDQSPDLPAIHATVQAALAGPPEAATGSTAVGQDVCR